MERIRVIRHTYAAMREYFVSSLTATLACVDRQAHLAMDSATNGSWS